MSDISVIIPVYNRDSSLKDAVESVLLQTYKPSEIIIIDDGSFISAKDILKNYLSHVKIISHKSNMGVSAARNTGVINSSSKYVAFLDSDDIFLPNKLEMQLKFMKDNSYKISHTNEFWYRIDKWVNQVKSSQRYGGKILEKILDKCRISPSSLMVEKDIFEKTGLFDTSLKVCEDYDISLRFALFYNIGYLDKKLIIKRAVEENSLSASINHIEHIRYNILKNFYEKYKDKLNKDESNAILKEIDRKICIIKPEYR